ncbi:hypothetical protein LJC49_07035 [Ruminococcaceae bacterium OttesenSCG-928-I18]|nr:hypothetical protein [Ruminococcaceae bacterium OttesenSCG-928-I18]
MFSDKNRTRTMNRGKHTILCLSLATMLLCFCVTPVWAAQPEGEPWESKTLVVPAHGQVSTGPIESSERVRYMEYSIELDNLPGNVILECYKSPYVPPNNNVSHPGEITFRHKFVDTRFEGSIYGRDGMNAYDFVFHNYTHEPITVHFKYTLVLDPKYRPK